MLNTRLDSVFESVMQRSTAALMEVIRPQARHLYSELGEVRAAHMELRAAHASLAERMQRELTELRTEDANLRVTMQRVRQDVGQGQRMARRLDRAARDLGFYADAAARNNASDWDWQEYL